MFSILWSTYFTFWLKNKTMVLIDKAEELISGGERTFLVKTLLQHPALSAEGVFEQGMMSLCDPPQHCWAEPGNFGDLNYSSPALSALTKHFAVVWVEGHKDISSIIEKNFTYLFFFFRFHWFWPKKHVGDEKVALLDHIPLCLLHNLPPVCL